MIRNTLLCLLVIAAQLLSAQDALWSLLPGGGTDRLGAIYSMDSSGAAFQIHSSFAVTQPGRAPQAELLSFNGQLWGVTLAGGDHGQGVLFSYDPSNGDYTPRHHFQETSGSEPEGGLLAAGDGKLYGLAKKGGSQGAGVLYAFDPVTGTYVARHHFSPSEGVSPWGTLLELPDGRLLGTAQGGGSAGGGALFAFHPVTGHLALLHSFTGADGLLPARGLVHGGNGLCYGTTILGGSQGEGILYSFSPEDSLFQILHHFGSSALDGSTPGAPPLWVDGALYGTTWYGGQYQDGVLYRYDTLTQSLTLLHHFVDSMAALTRGALRYQNQTLYGLASQGGACDLGSLYAFSLNTQAFRVLQHFMGLDGSRPYAALTWHNGRGYGLSSQGGQTQSGTLFSFDPMVEIHEVDLHFSEAAEGAMPEGNLLPAPDGWLYGRAALGGRFGHGLLFRFDPVTRKREKLHDFSSGEHGSCEGLTLGANGRIYGTLLQPQGPGLLFEWDPTDMRYRTTVTFSDSSGREPVGALLSGSDGRLYGQTQGGGNEGLGTLYAYDPDNDSLELLHAFSATTGFTPCGTLLEANNGRLYGVCSRGGVNPAGGLLFEWNPLTASYRVLAQFQSDATGMVPVGGLLETAPGILAGCTLQGGQGLGGTLFTFSVQEEQVTLRHHFSQAGGTSPRGNLRMWGNRLFGLAGTGGNNDLGVAFSFDLSDDNYRKLRDFDVSTGVPGSSFSLLESSTSLNPALTELDLKVWPNPVRDLCWLEGGESCKGVFYISLSDLSGKILLKESFLANGAFSRSFRLNPFPAGAYLLQVNGAGGHYSKMLILR